jgi:hypothetical protein
MKRFFLRDVAPFALALAALLTLTSCYTEPNPLNSVATVGGPVAIIRSAGFLNNTRVFGSDIVNALPEAPLAATSTLRLPNYAPLAAPTSGGTVTIVVEYTTLETPATAVNLYTQSGTTRTRVANVMVNVTPSVNRVRQNITYTIPAGTSAGTRIVLLASVATANGESWSGTGVVSAAGAPTAGTFVVNVR